MMKFNLAVAATSAVLCFAVPAQSQDASTVLATVGDTKITLGHVIALASRLPEQYDTVAPETLLDGIVDQIIQQTLLSQQVDGSSTRIKLATENEVRALMATEAIQTIANEAVSEEALRALHAERFIVQDPQQEFDSAHILVETEAEAYEIIAEVNGGADFAEMAKKKSTGPSGARGGALGWAGPGQMVPEFENAALAMDVGDISPPIETQFGWHVLKLEGLRDLPVQTFEEVSGSLAEEIRTKAIDAKVAEMEAATKIEKMLDGVDAKLIRDQSLLEN